MNLNVLVGETPEGEKISVDFASHHFVLLVGATHTGKSVFHRYLYQALTSQNSVEEISLIFLDMTIMDHGDWRESPYLAAVETRPDAAISYLESLGEVEESNSKHTFIHIEECDMFAGDRAERTESAIRQLLAKRRDITIVYSTSRPSPQDALRRSLLAMIDVKFIFELATVNDLRYLLGGGPLKMPKHYEKIVALDSGRFLLRPFTSSEATILSTVPGFTHSFQCIQAAGGCGHEFAVTTRHKDWPESKAAYCPKCAEQGTLLQSTPSSSRFPLTS